MKANKLYMDKRNSLVFETDTAFAPIWHGQNKELETVLNEFGAVIIQVRFNTHNEQTAKQDIIKYSRRLRDLSRYRFLGFKPLKYDGYISKTSYVGILKKI